MLKLAALFGSFWANKKNMFNCLSPFSKRDEKTGQNMDFPCGKCYPCLRRRTSGWSFRLVNEGKYCLTSYFLTFTYAPEHVPITSNNMMTLDKTHFQKFMKRYRKAHHKKYGHSKKYPVKYFVVGEYGSKTMRPHYHAIMYNVDVNMIEKIWDKGSIYVGTVSEASIGYTLKYMMKESKIPQFKGDIRNKEFQLMSKGLGQRYITENAAIWHHSDLLNRFYLPIEGGKKIAMPRYYKKKLYTEQQLRKIGEYMATVEKPDLTGEQQIQRFDAYKHKLKNARLCDKF